MKKPKIYIIDNRERMMDKILEKRADIKMIREMENDEINLELKMMGTK